MPIQYKNERDQNEKPDYTGRVLNVYSSVERVMSDVWDTVKHADVYDPDNPWGYTTLWLNWDDVATVDATHELLEQVAKIKRDYQENQAAIRAAELAEIEAKAIKKGRRVRVMSGRKVKIGTEATVFWIGNNPYDTSNAKVGIALTEEKNEKGFYTNVAFTYEKNLKVIIAA